MGAIAGIAMPLIGKGIEAGVGAIAAGKEKKKAKAEAPEGMAEAGGAAAKGAGGADGGQAAQPKADPIDRFLGALDSPNIKSVGDIKNFRDQVLGKMQQQGLNGEQMDNAKKKLNQAILKKLGIAQPGPNGAMVVNMSPQNQQILQALGMAPDQVVGKGQAGAQPAVAGAQPAAAGAQPAAAGAQPVAGAQPAAGAQPIAGA